MRWNRSTTMMMQHLEQKHVGVSDEDEGAQQQLYVELIVKNPVCSSAPSLDSELFSSRLDAFIRALPYYSPRAA